jgi:hypothetical protein
LLLNGGERDRLAVRADRHMHKGKTFTGCDRFQIEMVGNHTSRIHGEATRAPTPEEVSQAVPLTADLQGHPVAIRLTAQHPGGAET